MRFNHISPLRSARFDLIVFGAAVLGFFFVASPTYAGQTRPDQPLAMVRGSASGSGSRGGSQNTPPSDQSVPQTLTLPAGTLVTVRVTDWLSSDQNRSGDGFRAVLEQPLIAEGWVIARREQSVIGLVTIAQKAGRVKGVSELGVELSELTLVDGQQLPLQTELLQSSAGRSRGRDAFVVGSTTSLGAAIGAVAHGGEGASIGAATGAVAGMIGVLTTRGKQTVIPPETLLTFRLEVPVTISTERSQVAFRPVMPEDYGTGALGHSPQRMAVSTRGYAPLPYYPYPYGYGYGYGFGYGYPYYYPPVFFGFYGGRGFGHGYGYGGFGHGGFGHGGFGHGGFGHGGFGRH